MNQPTITEQLEMPAEAREAGRRKIAWARQHMPIMTAIAEEFGAERPLEGETVAMAMHVEAKTAVLTEVLAEAGAEVAITGCNPLSTHDDVSAALDAHERITSYAKHDVDDEAYYAAMEATLDHGPTVTVDDGGDLVMAIHEDRPELLDSVVGGCEETTTGVHRLRAMDDDGALNYPMFAVNDTPMKRLFDNVHGTGEATLSNVAMTTTVLEANERFVVIAMFDSVASPVPWTLSNSRFIGVSLTANIGYSSSPSSSIARNRWTPVVVSSQPPRIEVTSAGWSSWMANTRSPPSSTVTVGPWSMVASMAA